MKSKLLYKILCNNLFCLNKSCKITLLILIFIGFVIIPLMIYFNKSYNLKIMKILDDNYEIINYEISGWRLSHVITYFIIGLICPNQFLLFLLIGIIWEIIEYMFFYFSNNKFWTNNTNKFQYKDIIANTIGYIFGALLINLLLRL